MPISIPKYIHTPDNTVNVLQLTDMHLHADINKTVAGIHLYNNFIACLNQALSEDIRCDLIVITGDLVNEMYTSIYDRIFTVLQSTGIAHICLAGNHDVTDELNQHLPFAERTFVAFEPDARLVHKHRIVAENWQLLFVDSSIPGDVNGKVCANTRQWLDDTLTQYDNPAVIFMHHHTLTMNSKWLDVHISHDSDLFWQLASQHPQVKAVINGHVHQEYSSTHNNVAVYSTPSTCYQFKPYSDEFALDYTAKPGYRWLQLKPDVTLKSWVNRLNKLATGDTLLKATSMHTPK